MEVVRSVEVWNFKPHFHTERAMMTSHKRTSVRRKGQRLSKEETAIAQEKFLKTFSTTANVRASCLAAGIDRSTFYSWTEKDEAFSFRWHQSEADASDVVLGALWQRAIQGVPEVVVSNGKIVRDDHGQPLMTRRYSDSLLALLAKAPIADFRDRTSVDLNANVNANVTQQQPGCITIDPKSLTDEELATLKRIAIAMKARQEEKS